MLPPSGPTAFILQPKVCKQESRAGGGGVTPGDPPATTRPHPAPPRAARLCHPQKGLGDKSGRFLQARGSTARRSGSATTVTTGARQRCGPWACCCTTWCAGTSPSSTTRTSCAARCSSGRGSLQVGTGRERQQRRAPVTLWGARGGGAFLGVLRSSGTRWMDGEVGRGAECPPPR